MTRACSRANLSAMQAKDSHRPVSVVIAGGGVAALETALALRDLAEGLVDVTLVSASDRFTFAPASVGVPFGKSTVRRFDMFRIANDLGMRLVVGRLASVDTDSRRVTLEDGNVLEYDALVIACGADAREAVAGATTFGGPGDIDRMSTVLADVREGRASKLMFALPASLGWALPLYELCLLTGQYLAEKGGIYRYPNGNMRREFVEIGVVTPEATPLEAFGSEAGRTVLTMMADRGIAFHPGCTPVRFHDGVLEVLPGENIRADRVVAMPQLGGIGIPGIPVDGNRLIRTDTHGRVEGVDGVYAAGDTTAFPIKQGGIAAQQAVATAQTIAAAAGADITPEPFQPVLRGLLMTGSDARYLRAEVQGGRGPTSTVAEQPLWWPPGKLAARYLGPYLAELDSDLTQRLEQ